VTGALAAIGANTATKRTALAHVLFNVATGMIAVALMPLLLWGIRFAQQHLRLDPGAMSLAAFHTTFIALGAALFLPFVDRFSGWIERLLPEKGPTLTRNLDPTLHSVPAVALEATRRALRETACATFEILSGRLPNADTVRTSASGDEIRQALYETRQFIARIPPVAEDQPISLARVSQMHAVDHLARLHAALEPPEGLQRQPANGTLREECLVCRELLELAHAGLRGQESAGWLETLEKKIPGHGGNAPSGATTPPQADRRRHPGAGKHPQHPRCPTLAEPHRLPYLAYLPVSGKQYCLPPTGRRRTE